VDGEPERAPVLRSPARTDSPSRAMFSPGERSVSRTPGPCRLLLGGVFWEESEPEAIRPDKVRWAGLPDPSDYRGHQAIGHRAAGPLLGDRMPGEIRQRQDRERTGSC